MKKVIMVALALVLVVPLFVAFASPALACVDGKSPGFWKNHPEAWPSPYNPSLNGGGTTIDSAFGFNPGGIYHNMTLMQALRTNGNSDGKAAFWRQAVAQLLNSRVYDLAHPASNWHVGWLQGCVQAIYPDGGEYHNGSTNSSDSSWDLEDWKDYFEGFNT